MAIHMNAYNKQGLAHLVLLNHNTLYMQQFWPTSVVHYETDTMLVIYSEITVCQLHKYLPVPSSLN